MFSMVLRLQWWYTWRASLMDQKCCFGHCDQIVFLSLWLFWGGIVTSRPSWSCHVVGCCDGACLWMLSTMVPHRTRRVRMAAIMWHYNAWCYDVINATWWKPGFPCWQVFLFPQFCQWTPWWWCQKDSTWVTFLLAREASHPSILLP
jgi:hypothetical protein